MSLRIPTTLRRAALAAPLALAPADAVAAESGVTTVRWGGHHGGWGHRRHHFQRWGGRGHWGHYGHRGWGHGRHRGFGHHW